ncbi:MAG: hypothetical protein IT428_33690 [Planctomycetaceae bacterium]|nr:hypothetical protein [Planctomycetaceae bacterium]
MNYEAIDRALGRLGQPPQPFVTTLSRDERDALLREGLCFPDRELPTGELAEWAVALIELGKDPAVMAAVFAVEAALSVTSRRRADISFVEKVLAELYVWLRSPKGVKDLRRLGDLWWSLTRNTPEPAHTPLGQAAVMAWYLAGYDPEGWGDPPEEEHRLREWIMEAANNVTAIIDVFSLVQQEVGNEHYDLLVERVRVAVKTWRELESPTQHPDNS